MSEKLLDGVISDIMPGDPESAEICRKRWDSIAKPLHSLGWIEEAVTRIASAQHSPEVRTEKKILITMCADNGVTEEGVTQTGQEVTAIVAGNFLKGKTCASVMCRVAGAEIRPIDIGMIRDVPGVEKRKIAYGTKNFAKEPAMSEDEAVNAILTGIKLAEELKDEGYDLIAAGEMGIGNTTTSAAVASALLKVSPSKMTGRGAGLSAEALGRKIRVISRAIDEHNLYNADPLTILASVGGFDIAGITGLFLGGAISHIPVLIDGFISSVGALLAFRLCPYSRDYMISSHVSEEAGARLVLEELSLKPALDAGMCLGEGSGAAAVFPMIDMGAEIYHKMATFNDINIEAYRELS